MHTWKMLTFASDNIIEVVQFGQLGIHKSPYNPLVVVRKYELLKGVLVPSDIFHQVDVKVY